MPPHPATMAADEAREDACRDYQSSLEDLTFNSKPHINMLTILAEENVQFARDIVTLIEAQIAKVFMTKAFYFILCPPFSPPLFPGLALLLPRLPDLPLFHNPIWRPASFSAPCPPSCLYQG